LQSNGVYARTADTCHLDGGVGNLASEILPTNWRCAVVIFAQLVKQLTFLITYITADLKSNNSTPGAAILAAHEKEEQLSTLYATAIFKLGFRAKIA
jgi:hypothetical protein